MEQGDDYTDSPDARRTSPLVVLALVGATVALAALVFLPILLDR